MKEKQYGNRQMWTLENGNLFVMNEGHGKKYVDSAGELSLRQQKGHKLICVALAWLMADCSECSLCAFLSMIKIIYVSESVVF